MSGPADPAPHIVVMGVSGSGKSTVGERLARSLGLPFIDADDLHPAENIKKMSAGIPLSDEDRGPWLEAVGAQLREASGGIVVACSALRLAYRDKIRLAAPETVFVHIEADVPTLRNRMDTRSGHFMSPSLLESQLATLEPLSPGEAGGTVSASQELGEEVAAAAGIVRRSMERHQRIRR